MWKSRDPLTTFMMYLRHRQVLTDEILIGIDQRVIHEIDEAVSFAESSPDPDPSEAATDMLA